MGNGTEFRDAPPDFEAQKRKYFVALGLKIREAIKLHQAFGLLTKNDRGIKEWRNVTEHQLVVAARTRALSRLVGLGKVTSDDLFLAAGMHDFYKRKTVEKSPKGVPMSMRQQIEAEEESAKELTKAGFPKKIIDYTKSIGSSPDTIHLIEAILKKGENASEQEIAVLMIHYVDDFTRGSDWANPAEVNEQGKKINDLNRRIQEARSNPKYRGVDEEGRGYFNGETTLNTQESVGEQVEAFLAQRLSAITGTRIDPKDLPALIDEKIKKTIDEA